MNLRQITEEKEKKYLSAYAQKSFESKGREVKEEKCSIRTDFQRDRDRILHSKSFRRLMYKTQVFIAPEGDHYRTRLTHTLEVSQVARTISRALNLNEDLTEAIALGHDLGHTPFGHTGENILNKLYKEGFKHNEQSVRVVEFLEKDGRGLNLTKEVLDGILNHPTRCTPNTCEGEVVQISDKIAYINHDIDDAIRANILTKEELPKESIKYLGNTRRERIDFLIKNIIENSMDKNKVLMSEEAYSHMSNLRSFLFTEVYLNKDRLNKGENFNEIISVIFSYFKKYPAKLPEEYYCKIIDEDSDKKIVDYIAGMTDRFCLKLYKNIKQNNNTI